MLDKKKTGRFIKIISLIAAISFVISFIPILYSGSFRRQPQPKQVPNTTTTTTTSTTSTNSTGTQPNAADSVKDKLSKAKLNIEIKNYELAVTYYKQALEADANSIEAKAGLGIAQTLSGKTKEGYDQLKQVTAADPNQAESQFYLGQAAAKLGKKAEAQAAYNAYLKLDPNGNHADEAKKALKQ